MHIIWPNGRAVSYFFRLTFLLIAANAAMIAQADFSISATPSSLSIPQNGQGVSIISTTISGGFNNPISLSASGVPMGVTVSFNPTTISPPGAGSSTMAISVVQIARTGVYPITVTGNGGGIRHTTTVTLTITAQAKANFSILAIPSSISIAQGTQGSSTIYGTVNGGFNSSINCRLQVNSAVTTGELQPAGHSCSGSGSSTMTFTVGVSTPPGPIPSP